MIKIFLFLLLCSSLSSAYAGGEGSVTINDAQGLIRQIQATLVAGPPAPKRTFSLKAFTPIDACDNAPKASAKNELLIISDQKCALSKKFSVAKDQGYMGVLVVSDNRRLALGHGPGPYFVIRMTAARFSLLEEYKPNVLTWKYQSDKGWYTRVACIGTIVCIFLAKFGYRVVNDRVLGPRRARRQLENAQLARARLTPNLYEKYKEDNCPFCREKFQLDGEVNILNCGHPICYECANQCYSYHPGAPAQDKCLVCQQSIADRNPRFRYSPKKSTSRGM